MPGEAERTDVGLLSAWRDGDQRAGDELLRRHLPSITRFFEAHNVAEADEMAQRTFTACIERRDHLREDANFRSYLFGIARNQLLRDWTAQRRSRTRVSETNAGLEDQRTSASGAVLREEELGLLREALVGVPEKYRVPLDLFYFEELSLAQIGERLSLPVGTIKSRLSRAKSMVRAEISSMRVTAAMRAWADRELGDDEKDR